LLPQIGLEDFERREEPQYRCISVCESTAAFGSHGRRRPIGQQTGSERSGSEREARPQEATAAGEVGGPVLGMTELVLAHHPSPLLSGR
jgi:hypothetical protein